MGEIGDVHLVAASQCQPPTVIEEVAGADAEGRFHGHLAIDAGSQPGFCWTGGQRTALREIDCRVDDRPALADDEANGNLIRGGVLCASPSAAEILSAGDIGCAKRKRFAELGIIATCQRMAIQGARH